MMEKEKKQFSAKYSHDDYNHADVDKDIYKQGILLWISPIIQEISEWQLIFNYNFFFWLLRRFLFKLIVVFKNKYTFRKKHTHAH